MKQVVGDQVREYGLTPAQFWMLNRVFEHEGLSLRELAESLHMDTPTASRVVAALVRLKYLRSEEDPGDRRRSRIVLSPKGRALADKLRPLAVQTRSAVEAPFTAAERETLRALLKKSLQHVSRL